MLITPSFKKSLIVEQFQGNYLKFEFSQLILCFYQRFKFLETNNFLHLFIPLAPFLFSFNFVILGKSEILTSWNSHKIWTGGFNTTDVLESMTL